MGLFARRESRSVSFQDVWGRGGDWSPAGTKYKPMDALAIAAVIGCVRHRVNLLSQLPMTAYRNGPLGFPVEVASQPPLIANPSAITVRSVWMAQMQISRDLWGNAFGAITGRDAAGYPSVVDWLPPDDVQHSQNSVAGRVRYTFRNQPFPTENMLLVPSSFNLPGSPFGMAPLMYAGLVDLGRQAQEFGADWFRNGATPASIIYADQPLDEGEATRIRDTVVKAWSAGRPGILGSGLKVEAVNTAKGEAQFNDTVNHVALSVCQAFGVPAAEVDVTSGGGTLTYANRTDAKQAAVDRMNGDIRIIQDVFTRAVPRPQFVKLNTGAYLQSDVSGRYATYEIAARIQQLTGQQLLSVDEMRHLEERAPLPPLPPVDLSGGTHA